MLKDKVAVVTGATGALGRVVTRMLLESGVWVAAVYRSEDRLRELEDFVGAARDRMMGVEADVTDESSAMAMVDKIAVKYGRVDVLLNIVGAYVGGGDVADTKESDWDYLMNVNLKSVFLCCKAVLPIMIKQNSGKIVNVGARPAVERRMRAKNGAYSVSKAGVVVLTEVIAEEVRKYDINVNCVLPSTIDTPANRRNMPSADFSKWVKPEDIAKMMLFLVSDESKVTSGAAVPVYGKA